MFTTSSPLRERRVHPQEAINHQVRKVLLNKTGVLIVLSISIFPFLSWNHALLALVLWLKLLVLVADRVASPWHVVPGSSTAMPADRTENGDAESAAQVSWRLSNS